ncbi:hypothetical protein BASA81_012904 [Batrachochytrium salamandrivorans]|nr:hypothetical protein BASA81_012904 [Batrachochytrium salamandrivorans]
MRSNRNDDHRPIAVGPVSDFSVGAARIDSAAKRLDFGSTPMKPRPSDFSRSFSPLSLPPSSSTTGAIPSTPLSISAQGRSFRSLSPFSAFDEDKFFAKPSFASPIPPPTPLSVISTTNTSFMAMSLVDKNASTLSPYREVSRAQLMLPYHSSSKPYNDHFISYSVAGILKPDVAANSTTTAPVVVESSKSRLSFAEEESLREAEEQNISRADNLMEEETLNGIWNRDKIWNRDGSEDTSFTSTEYSQASRNNSEPKRFSSRFGSKFANDAYSKRMDDDKWSARGSSSSNNNGSRGGNNRGGELDELLDQGSFGRRRRRTTQPSPLRKSSGYSRERGLRAAPVSSKLRYENPTSGRDYWWGENDNEEDEEHPRTREEEARLRLLRRRGHFDEDEDLGEEGGEDEDGLAWSRRRSGGDDDYLLGRRGSGDEENLYFQRRRFQGDNGEEEGDDDDERLGMNWRRRRHEKDDDDELSHRRQGRQFDLDRFKYTPKLRKGGDTMPPSQPPLPAKATTSQEENEEDDDYLLDIARHVMDRPLHTLDAMMLAVSHKLNSAATTAPRARSLFL